MKIVMQRIVLCMQLFAFNRAFAMDEREISVSSSSPEDEKKHYLQFIYDTAEVSSLSSSEGSPQKERNAKNITEKNSTPRDVAQETDVLFPQEYEPRKKSWLWQISCYLCCRPK